MMNLFRSKEHVDHWLGERPPGATIPVTKLSQLAHDWWGDRLSPHWQPHTREQIAAGRVQTLVLGPRTEQSRG